MGDKLRVLIVDDELPIRERLKNLDWSVWHAEWIGDADNGEVALDFCAENPPDVVVADITMPIMNGLELFHVLQEKFPSIKVILLTNHNDFEYARQSIKLGAIDYLLKAGFSTDELGRALMHASKELIKDRLHRVNKKQQERLKAAEQFRKLLIHPEQYNTSSFTVFPIGQGQTIHTMVLGIRLIGEAEDLYFADPIIQDSLESMELTYRYKWFTATLGQYLLISDNTILNTKWFSEMQQLIAHIKKNIQACGDTTSDELILFAHGESVNSIQGLLSFYEQSVIWNDIYFYEESLLFTGNPQLLSNMDEELANRITMGFQVHQGNELLTYIQDYVLMYARENRIYPNELIKELVSKLCTKNSSKDNTSNWNDKVRNNLNRVRTLRELNAELVYFISKIEMQESRSEIVAIKNYVVANLDKPLSLSTIASEVGYNSQYLGKLFHEETGENFKAFVTRVRMEKAMDLIWKTNKKIYLIAEEVGFANYRYFTTIFQKYAGLSPTEYKKG